MKPLQKLLVSIGAVIALGAFLTFVLLAQTDLLSQALLIGYFYALSLFAAIWTIHRFIAAKLAIFSIAQQWALKTILYTIAISFAYLTGLVFQALILMPVESVQETIIDNLWKGLVYLVTLPFSQDSVFIPYWGNNRDVLIPFFAMLFLIGLISMVGSFVEIRWKTHRQQLALERAELAALRAQIEPHFLFNSLNTIVSLVKKDPGQAEQLLIQLSNILRYLFQYSAQETIELKREIEFTREYLNLLKARFGKKLRIDWVQTIHNDAQKIPVLLMQPIIENAIRHGWPVEDRPMELQIQVNEANNGLTISIADNGCGISPEKLKKLPIPGHALDNISERLFLQYRRKDLLKITSEDSAGTTVEIRIPGHGSS